MSILITDMWIIIAGPSHLSKLCEFMYYEYIVSVSMRDARLGSWESCINILPLQDSIKTKPFCSNSLVKDSPPQSPFSANFAPSCNIKRQAWKETYKCKHCDCLLANSETFDETHARDVPTALQMVTFTKVSKRKKSFKNENGMSQSVSDSPN